MKRTVLCGTIAAMLLLCACAKPAGGDSIATPAPSAPEAAVDAATPDGAATDEEPVFAGDITDMPDFPYEIDAQGFVLVTDPEYGYSIGIPKEAINESLVILSATPKFFGDEEYPIPGAFQLDVQFIAPELWDLLDSGDEGVSDDDLDAMLRTLLVMHIFDAKELDALLAEGKTLDEITGESGAQEIGRQQDYAYVYATHPEQAANLSATSKGLYAGVLAQVPQMVERLKLIDIEAVEANTSQAIPPFQATDLSGAFVTNAIFETKKLTMVNIWATFCNPCIEEMPGLGDLARNMPEGTQLVGIVTDAKDNMELAGEILQTARATDNFLQIVPDDTLNAFLQQYQSVPTTVFVDAAGQMVGEPIVGAKGEAAYRKAVEERLLLATESELR